MSEFRCTYYDPSIGTQTLGLYHGEDSGKMMVSTIISLKVNELRRKRYQQLSVLSPSSKDHLPIRWLSKGFRFLILLNFYTDSRLNSTPHSPISRRSTSRSSMISQVAYPQIPNTSGHISKRPSSV